MSGRPLRVGDLVRHKTHLADQVWAVLETREDELGQVILIKRPCIRVHTYADEYALVTPVEQRLAEELMV